MKNSKEKNIIIATGGSGGHIFPAISVADILLKNNYNVSIFSDDLYNKYASNYNYEYKIIDSDKNYKTFRGIKTIFLSTLKAISLLKIKKVDLIIGFGSYATLPTLIASVITRTPFILHEQNAYIGKTNKVFSKFAKKIMTAYPEIYGLKFKEFNKIVYTGNPIRQDIKNLANVEYKITNSFYILITGGSLGAKVFSEFLPKIFDKEHKKEQENLIVYHQVQEEFVEGVKKYYKEIGLNAEVSPFFKNMHELLTKANLVIGRAGNGTLTETAIAKRPAIFIPLPTAANNHQEINSRLFERTKSAIVVLEKNLKIKSFQVMLFDLIKDHEKLNKMSNSIQNHVEVNADNNILNVVNEILTK